MLFVKLKSPISNVKNSNSFKEFTIINTLYSFLKTISDFL